MKNNDGRFRKRWVSNNINRVWLNEYDLMANNGGRRKKNGDEHLLWNLKLGFRKRDEQTRWYCYNVFFLIMFVFSKSNYAYKLPSMSLYTIDEKITILDWLCKHYNVTCQKYVSFKPLTHIKKSVCRYSSTCETLCYLLVCDENNNTR